MHPLILVSDEILYHAKLHPEQYSDTFSSAQLKQLHASVVYVCQTAVDLLAESSKFPEEWLFKHRWGKGKKDAPTSLPNGEKITFLKVGGRTSCVVPSVQKKTGDVAGDLKTEDNNGEWGAKTNGKSSKKRKAIDTDDDDGPADVEAEAKASKKINSTGTGKKTKQATTVKAPSAPEEASQGTPNKSNAGRKSTTNTNVLTETAEIARGRRRSVRVPSA